MFIGAKLRAGFTDEALKAEGSASRSTFEQTTGKSATCFQFHFWRQTVSHICTHICPQRHLRQLLTLDHLSGPGGKTGSNKELQRAKSKFACKILNVLFVFSLLQNKKQTNQQHKPENCKKV